jgi:hypothetical protein
VKGQHLELQSYINEIIIFNIAVFIN